MKISILLGEIKRNFFLHILSEWKMITKLIKLVLCLHKNDVTADLIADHYFCVFPYSVFLKKTVTQKKI